MEPKLMIVQYARQGNSVAFAGAEIETDISRVIRGFISEGYPMIEDEGMLNQYFSPQTQRYFQSIPKSTLWHTFNPLHMHRIWHECNEDRVGHVLPLYFLERVDDCPHAFEFDVHESLLFQMLNLWDNICQSHRVAAVQTICEFEKCNEADTEDMRALAMLPASGLMMALIRNRGKFLKENAACNHEKRTQIQFLSNKGRLKTACACMGDYHFNVMCRRFYETYTQIVATESEADRSRYKFHSYDNRAHFLRIFVSALLFVREGLQYVALRNTRCGTQRFRVMIKLLSTDHVLFHADPTVRPAHIKHDGKGNYFSLLECNHVGVCEMLVETHVAKHVCMEHKTKVRRDVPSTVMVYMENNDCAICAPEDHIVAHCLTALHEAYNFCLLDYDFMPEFEKLLKENYPTVPSNMNIAEKVRWLAFEFMYVHYMDVYPVVSPQCIPVSKGHERLSHTYGVVTEHCGEWEARSKLVSDLIEMVTRFHEAARSTTLAMLIIDDEEQAQRLAAKKTKKSKNKKKNNKKKKAVDKKVEEPPKPTESEEEEEEEQKEEEVEEEEDQQIKKEEVVEAEPVVLPDKENEPQSDIVYYSSFEERLYEEKLINMATFAYQQMLIKI